MQYSKGDVKAEAQELSEQIKMRMEIGVTEITDGEDTNPSSSNNSILVKKQYLYTNLRN